MGYIINGVYHTGNAPVKDMTPKVMDTKQWSHDRQREDNRVELIQPYKRDGTPNDEFIENYPEESKNYGFTKDEE